MKAVTAPDTATDRFSRTVYRISAELFWLKTYQAAIEGLTVDAIGLDFFRVSLNALKDARLIRLIRVLEDDSRTASFWYLLRTNEKLIRQCAMKTETNLEKIQEISKNILPIRDKTFVHIDKDGVFDTQKFYEIAGITYDDVKYTIEKLWATMNLVYIEVFGAKLEGDDYDGSDIKWLAELRDQNV